jgi:carbamoyl-phosphate synthase large subunit
MAKKINILVTGVGAVIGYGIIDSLRQSSLDIRIIGTDIFEENYGKYVCDEFVRVPYTSDITYKTVISELILAYEIDIVFPGIEQDVFFFAQNKDDFHVPIVLNNLDLIFITKNKFDVYNYLKNVGFENLIPTYEKLTHSEAISILGLPYIIKPKESYAAKGFHIIHDEIEYNNLVGVINDDTLFQPYIGSLDEEYTVSVFGDSEGGFIDSYILRRYLSVAGASEKVFCIKSDVELMSCVDKVVKIFKPEGPTNMQFRKMRDKVYLLEINPRISSACSLRTKFGYNEPLYCVQHYLLKKSYVLGAKSYGKAIRYIADKIILG